MIIAITLSAVVAVGVIAATLPALRPAPPSGPSQAYLDGKASLDAARARNPQFSGWRYSTQRDQMRGLDTRRAELQADNYNASFTPILTVWRRSDGQTGAQLAPANADMGWLTCPAGSRTFAVKIDDQPVRELRCDQTTNVVFEPRFVSLIRGSRRIMIEVDGAYGGRTQFTFQTVGLSL